MSDREGWAVGSEYRRNTRSGTTSVFREYVHEATKPTGSETECERPATLKLAPRSGATQRGAGVHTLRKLSPNRSAAGPKSLMGGMSRGNARRPSSKPKKSVPARGTSAACSNVARLL